LDIKNELQRIDFILCEVTLMNKQTAGSDHTLHD